MPKTNGPTIHDLAAQSGLSVATVDRVLNRRPGVRELTRRKVLKAAVDIGYLLEETAEETLRPAPLRLVFLLPAGTNPYFKLLGDAVKAASMNPALNVIIRCFFVESFSPQALSQALQHYSKTADGIAFLALNHPEVRQTVVELRAKGKEILTIVSDITDANRSYFVGLDNKVVGRTAAYLLGRLLHPKSGKVALIAASESYLTHVERKTGFLSLMEERYPDIELIGVREGHDQRDENYQHALTLLDEYPDLVGIYNAGGSSDGVARALRERHLSSQVLFIGHGLTPDTRKALLEDVMDVIITQSPQVIVQNTIQIFTNLCLQKPPLRDTLSLNMQTVFRENLPTIL